MQKLLFLSAIGVNEVKCAFKFEERLILNKCLLHRLYFLVFGWGAKTFTHKGKITVRSNTVS